MKVFRNIFSYGVGTLVLKFVLLLGFVLIAAEDTKDQDSLTNLEESIKTVNTKIKPLLDDLLTNTLFFSHYKINLNSKCRFWDTNLLCTRTDCSVIKSNSNVSATLWNYYKNLGKVDLSNSLTKRKSCQPKDCDFCYLEDEFSQDSTVVSLIKNKERYTGYGGQSANKVWKSVYEENCFSYSKLEFETEKKAMINKKIPQFNKECAEKTTFYKLISGMHASISIHLCSEFYDPKSNNWIQNSECFYERVGRFQDRIDNLYFNYALLSKAVYKAIPYLRKYEYCDNKSEAKKIRMLLKNIQKALISAKTKGDNSPGNLLFDETHVFKNKPNFIKEQFKHHFRNISLIMDCVECEKCKLWGKIQVTGYGTALKLLFSLKKTNLNYQVYPDLLQRTEIIALLNTFGRVAHSVSMVEAFEREKEQRNLLKTRFKNYFLSKLTPITRNYYVKYLMNKTSSLVFSDKEEL